MPCNSGSCPRKSAGTTRNAYVFATILAAIWMCLCSAAPRAAKAEPAHVRFIAGYRHTSDFLEPLGLDYDEVKQEIYVADTGNGRVCVFTLDGMPVYEFKSYLDGDARVNFGEPQDVAVDSTGKIYVSDLLLGQVVAMNFRGDLEYILDLSRAGPGRISPGRIALDDKDNLFVGDGTNNQALVFDSQGKFKFRFGKKEGDKPGIEQVNDIYPDAKNSRIYITSKSGIAVLIYNYSGELAGSFGVHDSGETNFSFPSGIAALPDGTLYVADTLRSEVKVYNPSGEFEYRFGGVGYGVNAIIFPVDLDIDADGNLFILEKTARRVHIFSLPGVVGKKP